MNTITINPNIPGLTSLTTGPCGWIVNFYNFALIIGGILAFGAIVYGGVKYAISAGNPSQQSEGRSWIWSALIGILLLACAYIILHTINPNLTKCSIPSLSSLSTAPIASTGGATSTTPTATSTTSADCSNPQALAQKYNEAYPTQNAPDLTTMINCIQNALPGVNLGPQFTSDQTYPLCNDTRGNPVCTTKCSHAVGSCHYGGHAGTQGAEGVDFDSVGANGAAIVNAALSQCSAKAARCENNSGTTVNCSGAGATHVHADAPNCDAN